MRPIKYRAFHKELKVMREVLEINIAHDEVTVYLENDDPEICECETWFEGTFELMQFTVLRDRNGKEIYEGDIVNKQYHNLTVGDGIGVVKMDEGSDSDGYFHGHWLGWKAGDSSLLDVHKECEIIGNIWENPELLESNI